MIGIIKFTIRFEEIRTNKIKNENNKGRNTKAACYKGRVSHSPTLPRSRNGEVFITRVDSRLHVRISLHVISASTALPVSVSCTTPRLPNYWGQWGVFGHLNFGLLKAQPTESLSRCPSPTLRLKRKPI